MAATFAHIAAILDGIDRDETDNDGWWETSSGAKFGAGKLAEVKAALEHADSKPVPTVRLLVECAMTNPPKSTGIGVYDGTKLIGVMTIEELHRCVARLAELQAAAKKTQDQPSE